MKRILVFLVAFVGFLCVSAQKYMVVSQGDSITRFDISSVDSVYFCDEEVTDTTTHGFINGHEWVDLGLPSGTLWATCNVGANTPEEYGDYFAWGETIGYNGGKTDYSWSTYSLCNGSISTMTRYCISSSYGNVDNMTELVPEDDVANVIWGNNWRMPTYDQQVELRTICTWYWTTMKNINGYSVTSKTNGNSIFLPAAGQRYQSSFDDVGSYAYFWSRMLCLDSSFSAYCLGFFSSNDVVIDHGQRYFGISVRPVVNK